MTDKQKPAQPLQYLPIEVSGRRFAIPMDGVVTIQRVRVNGDGLPPNAAENMSISDLRSLFSPVEPVGQTAHAIVITTAGGLITLLVDNVRSARMTEELVSLPYLVDTAEIPFSQMIREAEGLTLLIDPQRLPSTIQQQASLKLVAERVDVS